MTVAPPGLKEARTVLLDNLGRHGLSPLAVGIVGDPAHVGGYHCGTDRVRRSGSSVTDYSVVESPRDRAGLSEYASALDVGMFSVKVNGVTHNLRTFSVWLVNQCRSGAADTGDIREVIYSPDGYVVYRWDRLGKRSTGDSSHLTHTHISEFRDARGRHMPGLMRRYLVSIGLLEADNMITDQDVSRIASKTWAATFGTETASGRLMLAAHSSRDALRELTAQRLMLEAVLAAVTDGDVADLKAHITAVAASLPIPTAQDNAEAFLEALEGQGPAETAQALVAVLGPERAALVAEQILGSAAPAVTDQS